MNNPHVLIVEDEFIIYQGMQSVLFDEGYTVADYAPSVTDAEKEIRKQRPDLVLLDIDLLGEETGIDLGKKLLNDYHIPFIYVTGLDDKITFREALKTKHKIFMVKSKPVLDHKTLLRHIETVLNNNQETDKRELDSIKSEPDSIGLRVLSGYLNDIQNGGKEQVASVKILWDDIVFISKDIFKNADGQINTLRNNYVWLKMIDGNSYFLKTSLSKSEEILPDNFSRINFKYIINITSPEFIGITKGNTIILKDRKLTLSRLYKDDFLKKLNKYFPNY